MHFVRTECDVGPIILQAAVPVAADDTPETLAARVLESEHRIYPEAVRLIATGQAKVTGERVAVAGAALPAATVNPPLGG